MTASTSTKTRWNALNPQVLLVILLLVGLSVYVRYSFQYFAHDDEGTNAYAAWRVSAGDVPYRDFLTDQMPVFLYWGGLIVRVFGRSFAALRLMSMLVALSSMLLLYALNRELYGPPVGLLAVALFLIEPNAYRVSRLFLSEPYMLLFDLVGLYTFVLGEKRRKRGYTWLAGACFALAGLTKLFGFLPLAGCFLYLLYAWRRERRPIREAVRAGLALGLPPLILVGAVVAIYWCIAPYFLAAVLFHHTMPGADLPRWQTVAQALDHYLSYVLSEPVMLGLAALGALTVLRRNKTLGTLLLWQLPTALVFLGFTRSLMLRYMTYLAPAIATLAGLALWSLLCRLSRARQAQAIAATRGRARAWAWGGSILALLLALMYPWAVANALNMARRETDSLAIADFVRSTTAPEELVVTDCVGINFLAGRRTTYWSAGISGVSAGSGQIKGDMLVTDMETQDVAMVIIDTTSRQFRQLQDYARFRQYVQTHYSLVDKRHRADHLLDIYTPADTMPLRLHIHFGNDLALTGARFPRTEVAGGDALAVLLRWQARGQMGGSYRVKVSLVDADGVQWAQAKGVSVKEEADDTPSFWEPDEVELQEHRAEIIPGTPPGSYYVTAGVYEFGSGQTVLPTGQVNHVLPTGEVVLATVRVLPAATPPRADTVHLTVALATTFSEGLELLGSDSLPTRAAPGSAFDVSLFWHALAPMPEDYRLEFRLVQGDRVLQRWPMEIIAGYPTSTWSDGEVVYGRYRLAVDGTLREGEYELRVAAVDRQGRALGEARLVAELPIVGD